MFRRVSKRPPETVGGFGGRDPPPEKWGGFGQLALKSKTPDTQNNPSRSYNQGATAQYAVCWLAASSMISAFTLFFPSVDVMAPASQRIYFLRWLCMQQEIIKIISESIRPADVSVKYA